MTQTPPTLYRADAMKRRKSVKFGNFQKETTARAPRRLLVAVVGMSPQVVTETIWVLIKERRFCPDEVRLITTCNGRNRALRDLLDPTEGRFHAFCRDYGLVGKIRFDEDSITVIQDDEGRELDDIRTPEENAAAADTIVRVIGNACSDPNTIVHVSIAGGRKSMGFFAGYAMSLFARARDSVSHVLVNEPFESNRDFFYPPPEEKEIVDARGVAFSSSNARVMLADIPIVRLRTGLPEDLLTGDASYGRAVEEAQRALFPSTAVIFRDDARGVVCEGIDVSLAPAQYAVFRWMAERAKRGESPVRPGLRHAEEEFFPLYEKLFPTRPGDVERARKAIRSDEDFLKYFQEKRSQIGAALAKKLGRTTAAHFRIVTYGKRPFVAYALALESNDIQLPAAEDR